MREEIDLARQPRGGLKERFFRSRLEERDGGAGEVEAVREVSGQFLSRESGHVMADDNPLRERLVHGHGEAAPQFGLAEQDEAKATDRLLRAVDSRYVNVIGHPTGRLIDRRPGLPVRER